MKYIIVLPVYNEEKKILNVLKSLNTAKLDTIIVDDGSSDRSSGKIEKYIKNRKNFILLRHRVNLGKGATLKTGCELAFSKGADAVIMMDSDGQHDVSDIDKFKEKIDAGYDVVLGSRNLNMGVPFDRYMGNKIASVFVSTLFGIYVSDLICGFRAITRKAYKKIKWESSGYGVETEMVIKIKKYNFHHCEVPVATIYYDNYKGVTIIDAFSVLSSIIKWRFKI